MKSYQSRNKGFICSTSLVIEKLDSTHNKTENLTLKELASKNQAMQTKLVSKKAFIKNSIKETIGNETAQAIIRIFKNKYKGLKVFWLLCLLGSVSLCFYLLIQTLLTYLSYPVYTTTTIVHEMPTVFPKITVCNSMLAITEYAFNKGNKRTSLT